MAEKLPTIVKNCIGMIQDGVLGRDVRRPIVTAIDRIYNNNIYDDSWNRRIDEIENNIHELESKESNRVIKMEPVLDTSVIDWIEKVIHIISIPATEYEIDSNGTSNLTISNIRSNEYLLTDSRPNDTISLLIYDSYLLNLNDTSWSESGLNPSSREEIEYVPHSETYLFTITRANGK